MQLTDQEKKRGVAYHEAGHATLTLISRFFQLTDPAIVLAPTLDKTAQSGAGPRPGAPGICREAGLEQAEIALGGMAGEAMLARISEVEGRRIVLHDESADFDINFVKGNLRYWKTENHLNALTDSALETLESNRDVFLEIAALIERSIGSRASLSKSEVEALPGVQRLMANKRPL